MHLLSVTLFVVALAAVVYSAPPAKYDTKFDHIDVDKILENPRVLTAYINCILDKGPCTPEGREFRKNLPDALQTSCEKCSEGQKKMIKKASLYIIKNRKGDWEKIAKKFDPKGENHESFQKFLTSA